MTPILSGFLVWGLIAFAIYAMWVGTRQDAVTMTTVTGWQRVLPATVAVSCILLCTIPMSFNPFWNGEKPGHRNQYEVLAESMLDGRLDLDYGDMDPKLLEMDNPYDAEARREAGVDFHWDHALYNGKYYMYFGVVPVLLLFLPYRAITGTSLTTYHATQIFTALFIVGAFVLFRRLARKLFPEMQLAVYLALSAAMSVMSVWYFTVAPALYCTAIAAGICMEIWSVYFFAKCAWTSENENQRCTRSGVVGSLLGALAFGCRPTVAMVNFLAAPLMLYYLIKRRLGLKQIIAVFLPYAIVGTLLMYYNYMRFENPFEFGQSYQLTVADQSAYGSVFSRFDLRELINGFQEQFFAVAPLSESFPYVSQQSVFFNFPICVFGAICLLQKDTLSAIRRNRMTAPMAVLLLSLILATSMQVLQTPHLLERYRSDIYWIIGIGLFLSFGFFLATVHGKYRRAFTFGVCLLAGATVFQCFLLWAQPTHDASITDVHPEYLDMFSSVLAFGAAGVS